MTLKSHREAVDFLGEKVLKTTDAWPAILASLCSQQHPFHFLICWWWILVSGDRRAVGIDARA